MKMSTIRVTQENPTEAAATDLIRALSAELQALYPNSHGGDGAGAFKPQDVMIPRATFVVAWNGETAVGCGALRPMDEPEIAEVKRMFVRPDVRGKGISRAILAALENQAREFGYKTLRLETGVHQKEAMRLYASSGYQLIPCYGIYVNEPLSRCYEKSLL
jgi:GNAT superfamily N-acetyltransferase